MAETTELNKTINKEYQFPCAGKCDTSTWHKVLASVDIDGTETRWDYHYWTEFQIVQCQGCRSISFRKNEMNSEDLDYDEAEECLVPENHIELFPKRVSGHSNLSQSHRLPLKVSSIYNETYTALCNEQLILAGIGLRALVETVCENKTATGHNLEQKIDDLVRIGVLTQDGADILHSLRIMGNKSAHEVSPHSEKDLYTALDVVNHLITGVYILPDAAKNLPKRK